MNKRIEYSSRFATRLTRDTLAVVLAGGRGTRLGALTHRRAKPAVPFGGKFRIIDFTLSNCVNSGIRRIAVLTQYRPNSLIRHIQQAWGFLRGEFGECVELLPASQRSAEGTWYTGTADAVYQNLGLLRRHDPSFVLVLAGDHIYKMDYGPMIARHVETGADITVGAVKVPVEQASSFGIMRVDADGRVCGFEEKPTGASGMPGDTRHVLASMGIYIFSVDALLERLERDAQDAASSHDFGHDVIPSGIDACRVIAYPFHSEQIGRPYYWRDVGTVDAYWRANMELLDVVPELDLYDRKWPVWTRHEQLPPAKFVFDDEGRRGMALDSMVSSGCIVSGAVVRRSLLFTGVRVEAGSELDGCVILPDTEIGPDCRLRRAVIDTGCVIPPGLRIGHDSEADTSRFYRTPEGVVLVVADMLDELTGTEA
ncbi:MAG: glucose-1-phosphate adenylyltransferase [Gammaproteobacteria bacterium]